MLLQQACGIKRYSQLLWEKAANKKRLLGAVFLFAMVGQP